MFKYVSGNLLEDKNAKYLCNAVNSLGFMDGGIAKAFKEKFPEMFELYQSLCKSFYFKVASLHVFESEKDDVTIFNVHTVDDDLKGNLELIEKALWEMRYYLDRINKDLKPVAIPPLGCGIGGLDKKDVEALIREVFETYKGEILLYNFKNDY